MAADYDEAPTLRTVRRILLLVLMVGMVGTATELLLLKHDEEPLQLVPLVLLAAAMGAAIWQAVRPGRASLTSLQIVMLLFILAGGLGVYFHFVANVAFQREVDPSIAGAALFWKAIAAKTPPALAPGAMVQMGLIGLAYTYQHPSGRPF
ncbi:MAG: hypothetical protein ABJC89_09975 [Acidobacteriota bacterium]